MFQRIANCSKPTHQRLASALLASLEKPKNVRQVLFGILVLHSGLLAYNAFVHSPTLNEPGHLVAGLSHLKHGRFELYRVNPPLVRMVAALPLMVVSHTEDWSEFDDSPGTRPVFHMGEAFVKANGERSYYLFFVARLACMPFSWLGAIVCYLWARDLYGRPAGVSACVLWCFSPNILAHASLVTADAHATALGLAACYTFWRWLQNPTWRQAAITGGILGIAELAKTTLIIFYPLWPILWIAYRWPDRHNMLRQDWFREAGMLFLRMAIGVYVLNVGYEFEGSFTPLNKFQFVSNLFTGNTGTGEENDPLLSTKTPGVLSVNRFEGTWFGLLPVPFPKHYLLGIDIQQKDFEHFHRPSYLRGNFRDHGWWYYYLYAIVIKVPLGTWGLAIILLSLRVLSRLFPKPNWRNEMILLAPPLVVFGVVSCKTGFSHHMRYVLPCFPFVFIWLSQVVWLASAVEIHSGPFDAIKTTMPKKLQTVLFTLVVCCLTWSVGSSLAVYPHNLSYFNELVGGPTGGANHLINSNIDWGQDLLKLRRWKKNHATELQDAPFHLAYYGFVSPSALGFSDALPWPTDDQDGNSTTIEFAASPLSPGYYAVSVNLLYGFPWYASDGQAPEVRLQQSVLRYFRSLQPCDRAGYSILIFHLPDQAYASKMEVPSKVQVGTGD